MRADAFLKVTGQAKYVDDLRVPGTLYVQTVRCPYPRAEIISIDAKKALAASGVVCVLTAKDIPGDLLAGPKDKPVLAAEEAKHAGDGIALVAAETRVKAEAAAKLVRVKYKLLSSVHTVSEALAGNAPSVHEGGNLAFSHIIKKGDTDAGFAGSDRIIEREYSTQRAMHGAIEPDGALAVPENGGLKVYCPCKAPFATRKAIAKSLGLRECEVRLIQPAIGGAFGGKYVDINLIASRLGAVALYTGRPCKTTWSREEVFLEGSKRHPFTLKYKAGVMDDGTINALYISGYADAGAYASVSKAVIWRAAAEAAGPYDIPNVRIEMHAVYTNNVYSDGVRGFGSPQVDFASESFMNEIAELLGIPPLEFRRKNILRDGGISATDQRLDEVNVGACLEKLEEVFCSFEKPAPSSPDKLSGRGISCIFRGEARGAAGGDRDGSAVNINLCRDGSINVYCGIAEMGQGGYGVVSKIVSDTLGVPIEDVRVSAFDSDYVPDGGPTTGSRGTITFGNAAYMACLELVGKMKEACSETGLCYDDMSFREAADILGARSADLEGRGYFELPETVWDFENSRGDAYASYNYAACGADVEIDPKSGEVKVTRLAAIHDLGRMIDCEEIKGQIAGGASMAVGLSLMEDFPITDGIPEVKNFDRYRIPGAGDICNIMAIPITPRLGPNPLGVKGIGEPSAAAVAPAIISAINDALGIKIRDLPATPEKILAAMEAQK